MKISFKWAVACAMAAAATGAFAQQGETVKIAWIDPLSGLMASVGANQLKTAQFFAQEFNKNNPAGVKFEVIGIDNKVNPQETVVAVNSARDQGVRYILQGNGSGPALAVIQTVEKNNSRNPDKSMLYLNYAAVDPDLTGKQCSYWQFAFDANSAMKLQALTDYIKEQAAIKKVYIIGQNYSFGQAFSRQAREFITAKRPDIQIVGDELHPMAQIRDFSPYIAKIKASGADTVITGNWGSDLQLLIKAANDAGLKTNFLTYYAVTTGTPTAMGSTSAGKVYEVGYGYNNMGGDIGRLTEEFRKKFNDDLYAADMYTVFKSLSLAMAAAKSTDPVKVAAAMEGLKFNSFNGDLEIRKTDHQLQQGLYISRWEKTDAKNPYSPENTGYTFIPVKFYDAAQVSTSTVCQMKRPGG